MIRTFAEVTAQRRNIQALHALMSAIGVGEPKPAQLIPIIVFMAFSIEAYVNNLGFRYISDWNEKERNPWKDKIKSLHKAKGISASWSSGPLAFASSLFKIRDRLAHGKPEHIEGPSFDSIQEAQNHIASSDFDPDWFSALGTKWYQESQKQFFELLEYLAVLHNLSPTDYMHATTAQATEA
jgi:hypothetical protein